MKLRAELLTALNLETAIALADECFSTADERVHFREVYQRVAQGQMFYTDTDMGCTVRLLPYFLYYRGAELVGTTGLYCCGDAVQRLWLGWFGIRASFRGTGIGTSMLSHISNLARSFGASELALYTSEKENVERVVKFYTKNGFQPLGRPHQYRAAQIFEYVKTL